MGSLLERVTDLERDAEDLIKVRGDCDDLQR